MLKFIFDPIKNAYMNMSYQNKLIISVFIIIMVPIIMLSSFSYYQNTEMIKSSSIEMSELYLHQVRSSVDTNLTDLSNVAKVLSNQSTIIDILGKDPSSIPFDEQFQDLKKLDSIIPSFSYSPSIYNIRLYVKDGFIYSNRNFITYNLDDIKDVDWAKILHDFYAVVYFTEPYEYTYTSNNTQRIISAIVPIRSSENFEVFDGVICVDMLEKDMLNLMAVADYSSKGEVLITDRNYEPIFRYTTTDEAFFESIAPMLKEDIKENYTDSVSVVDTNVVGEVSLWNTWKLVSITPIEDLLATQYDLKLQFILSVILASVCVFFVAYFYGRHNAKRINNLAKQIRVVERGNFDVCCVVDSADEIGDLQTSFNYMVQKIQSLMEDQYQLGKNLNLMEMRVLQSQINPHFLYNTLDLILWTAKRNDVELVCDIVIKLSKFYRISLSNGYDYIDLIDEIEHVRLYVELQNLRFAKKIDLVTDIDSRIEDHKIMKLFLQPIVENSILHGISNSDVEQGKIFISAALKEDVIEICVKDNGIGMDQSTVAKLIAYSEFPSDREYVGGYGLKNVIDRLKLYYDNQAQILFKSLPNIGTEVIITIPYEYHNKNLTAL